MRVILYTGKGGVGKTTLSAATAIQAARRGYRTLVISTDPAHSLSDSFDMQLGSEPTPIVDKLWGQEINVLDDIHKYWGELQSSLSSLLITKGFNDVVADELAVMPGMEEVCSLLHINEKAKSGQFDCIILDCAPTGETIRFLSLPDVIDWYLDKLFSISRKASRLLQPMIKTALVIPGAAVFEAIETLFGGIAELQQILLDHSQTSIRIVLTPEKMVMKEALRSYSYFALFSYNVDMVLLNRVVPDAIESAFLKQTWHMQQKYSEEIKASFAPIPILEIPLMPHEVVGLEKLTHLGQQLFGNEDPTRVFFAEKVQEVVKENGCYILKRHFPAFEREKFHLMKKGEELVISINNVRHTLILPRSLALLEPQGAQFVKGNLQITFQ